MNSPHNNNLKFDNLEQVQTYAQQNQKTLLLYNDYILDVTTFKPHHPGGGLLLRNQNMQHIEQQMKFHHPLSIKMANSMAIGSFKQQIQQLVDPNQPLGQQIYKADHQTYLKIIHSPHWLFAQSPRLFKNQISQQLSHNKWYIVPFAPSILIAYYFFCVSQWNTLSVFQIISAIVLGMLTFSLVEYCLHRFLFHSQGLIPNNNLARYIHFFTHGIHHMLPNDPDRLVLPVPLFLVIYFLVLSLLQKIIPLEDPLLYAIFWSSFLLEYMIYDISHYALHHIDTVKYKGGWFHKMQKYHNRHHFGSQLAGYGVSSPFWDIIFRSGFSNNKKE